jgi:hypothetical protein
MSGDLLLTDLRNRRRNRQRLEAKRRREEVIIDRINQEWSRYPGEKTIGELAKSIMSSIKRTKIQP